MTVLTVANIQQIGREARVRDITLAHALGFERATSIRVLISRNSTELQAYGGLHQIDANRSDKGGRPTRDYWLNEPQALLLCMFARTPQASETRKQIIEVFTAWRRGKTVPVKAHARKPATSTPIYSLRMSQPRAGAPFFVEGFVPASVAIDIARAFAAEM